MKMTHDNLIFCGDFNADIDWDDHSTSSLLGLALLDLMDESNLIQLIDFSTAVSGILDLFFVSENVDFIHINRIDDGINISNHYPIAGSFTMRNVLLMPRLVHRQNYFSYCKGDYDKLNRLIFESPFLGRCWSNVNVLVKEWEIWFKSLLPLAVPIRTRHRASLSPWISSNTSYHLKKLSTLKRKLPSHSKVAVKELECVRLISRDKLEYQISLADNRNTISLFKYYRSFNKSALPSKIHFNSLIAQGDSEQADLFANYFSSVYKVSTEFDPSSLSFESELPIVDNIIFEDSNVMQIYNGLHVNKASGPDSLPASIYKHTSSSISKSLCQLFRKKLQTSLYPTAWKLAHVIPIYKKGSKADVKNYRPVSLLPICSKKFERCIFIDLYNHYSGWFHDAQFGFRKNRSPTIQLIIYLDTVYKFVNNGQPVNVIYTDFEKAFDRVDHGILLRKLYSTGIRGKLLSLLQSYLSNRTQVVKVGNSLSKGILISSGVPQGALLSALLFLVFINDLPSSCSFSYSLLCADDAKFISFDRSPEAFQSDLNSVFDWSIQNKIPFNLQKCSHLLFSGSYSGIYFDDNVIPPALVHKDLGLVITSNLDWTLHITTIINSAMRVFQMVKRSSPFLPVFSKLNIYKSMILPKLLYSSSAFGLNVTGMKRIEGFQRKVCRWITPGMNYKDALKFLNILPLPFFIQLNDLLLYNKILTGRYDYDFSDVISPLSTRSCRSASFQVTRPRRRQCEHNFWFRTARLISLAPPIIDVFNSDGFKSRCLKWMWRYFDHYFNPDNSCTWKLYCDCTRNNCRLISNRLT